MGALSGRDRAERGGHIDRLLERLQRWARTRDDVAGLALVGSWARGSATASSDVDIVLIADHPGVYLENDEWLSSFGRPVRIEAEDWGRVESRRVFYADGLEVEFGLTSRRWAALDPVDEGTRRVVSKGLRVIFERDEEVSRLVEAVGRGRF